MAGVNRVGAVNVSNAMAFRGKEKPVENANQPKVVIVRQTGGVAPAVISAVVPGLGQLFDGRPGAAAGAFFGTIGMLIASLAGWATVASKVKHPAAGAAAGIVGVLATVGAYLANIVNAAKGKKVQVNLAE